MGVFSGSQKNKKGKARLMRRARTRGCHYCGCVLTKENITFDHVIPKALGGSSSATNLAPCCKACNGNKADRLIFK